MHNLFVHILFYCFAGLTILSALLAITQNNPVRSVLFLVLAFITSSVLWILVNAEFLALILVLVYVGAVMTLFLFVVMMLNIDIATARSHFLRYLPFGLIIIAILAGLLYVVIPFDKFGTDVQVATAATNVAKDIYMPDELPISQAVSNTERIGLVLYTQYIFAFELAALILLVAIIAAITLVHRSPQRSKRQNIVQQLMTRKADRLELIRMKSEK